MLLALLLASAPLTSATRAYADLDYEACVSALSGMKGVPGGERARAELLLGLCHFALGHEKQAGASIENALRRDPAVKAPANASPKELAFIDAQRAAAAEPRRKNERTKVASASKSSKGARGAKDPGDAPDPEPGEQAGEPAKSSNVPPAEAPPSPLPAEPTASAAAPTAPSPDAKPALTPSTTPLPPAVDAALPGKSEVAAAPKATWLPWVTGGVAVAAAGVGAGLGVNAAALEAKGRAEPVQLEAARLGLDAQTNATGANVAFAVAGTAAVTTVVAFLLTR